jgi:protein phosphatase
MIKMQSAALTDAGRQRSVNEDRVWAQVYSTSEGLPLGLFIVCDGIGGHLGGAFASHWAVEAIRVELADLFRNGDPRATVKLESEELEAIIKGEDLTRSSASKQIVKRVKFAVERANQVVYEYAKQKPQQAADAGTTVTMAVVHGYRAVIANVGDSRTYLLRDGNLHQITQDHSLVASLVASGQISPEEIYTHSQRNLIYRSLGHKPDVQVDTYIEAIRPGDYLFFCTDGLWEMVQDEKVIARLISDAETLEDACRNLVVAANTAGGEDNIGVVIAKAT